ncbi:MAG: hypothetical protein IJ715_00100, partial [Bacilli bacterium]|nr:hypothetical protein [Bacilli bacterium]
FITGAVTSISSQLLYICKLPFVPATQYLPSDIYSAYISFSPLMIKFPSFGAFPLNGSLSLFELIHDSPLQENVTGYVSPYP